MKTMEEKEKFIELRAEGYSFNKISEMLNVSKPVLLNWAVELKEDIEKTRTIKKDLIIKEYQMAQENILEQYGKLLKRVNEEIEKRDLKEVSTIKLLEYQLKLLEAINKQDTSLMVKVDTMETLGGLKTDYEID